MKKKIWNLWSIFGLLCVGLLAFAACDDDDDDGGSGSNGLVGTWECKYDGYDDDGDHYSGTYTFVFKNDGTYKVEDSYKWDDYSVKYRDVEEGEWLQQGDNRIRFTPTSYHEYENGSLEWEADYDDLEVYSVYFKLDGKKLTLYENSYDGDVWVQLTRK